MKKIIFLTILIYWSFFNIADAWVKYPYVCNNLNCYNTNDTYIKDYYLYDVKKTNVNNFSSFIDDKLDNFVDYYGKTTFIINWFSTWSNNSLNLELTLEDLLLIDKNFKAWNKSYSSWKDYFFLKFKDIIDTLHVGFPSWGKINNLWDIFENILSYDNNNFEMKNVCIRNTWNKCWKSSKKSIWINDPFKYRFVSWTVKTSSSFKNDTFIVSNNYNLSSLYLKSWESLNFNFWFEDFLDDSSNNTKYEYRIYYNYVWDSFPSYDNYFLKETIDIKNSNYNVSSPNIANNLIWNIIDLTVIENDFKKVRIWVKEWIKLTKRWKINFYLSAKNVNTWHKFDIKKINNVPVTVLPNDNNISWTSEIISVFNSVLNSVTKWFNIWDTFSVKLNLKDEFWNEHFDYIWWYDISLSAWSSNAIKLSEYWSNAYSNILTWVKTTDTSSPYSLVFKFKITEPWYHDLNWFDIKVRAKSDNNNSYKIPASYFIAKNIVPFNLFTGGQKMKIYIKEPTYSELPVVCWKNVNISYSCSGDNFSWCNNSKNTSILYTLESQNWTTGFLTVSDNAYNVKNYSYTLNHIDQTAPQISLFKWVNPFNWGNFKSNSNNLRILFNEVSTNSCDKSINYIIKLNWVQIAQWNENQPNLDVDIPDFFKIAWDKELYIKATDKYWNFKEKTLSFKIFPSNVSSTESVVNLLESKNSKFANNVDFYTYKILLKDDFWNFIYNKNVDIDQKNPKSIVTNMILNSWDDAIFLESLWTKTDNNGEISLKLKSLVPGAFTEEFTVKLPNWDDNYINTAWNQIEDLWISIKNNFLYPLEGEINVSSNSWTTWDAKPEFWTNQNYRLNLVNTWSLSNVNWTIDISNWTIRDNIVWHIFQNFNVIDNIFNFSILDNKLYFDTRINATLNVLTEPNIWSFKLPITYTIWWKVVKYYFKDFSTVSDVLDNLWLRIIWNSELDWKALITWQEDNFTNSSKIELRAGIKRKIYNLIKSLNSNQIVNWIMYVKWDYTINSSPINYETIVVEDWNLTIWWNIDNTLGIIVLNNNLWDKTKWNIYVNQNVTFINAILYADGWFISSNSSWVPYTIDNNIRTNNLQKQLILKWTLFSRNTVGWSVLWISWNYLLPWWEETNNFDEAMVYDLNYIRRWKIWCADANTDWICDLYADYFIIIYNPEIQANPPKWF